MSCFFTTIKNHLDQLVCVCPCGCVGVCHNLTILVLVYVFTSCWLKNVTNNRKTTPKSNHGACRPTKFSSP